MRARDLALLGLLLPALLAALLCWPPITTRGEAREGLVVRELVRGGDWVLPHRQGVIASKPPLYHWLAAAAVRGLGWSDAAVRLPSVLAAWAMALETFAVGLLVARRGVAWLAVGILFASWGFVRSALEARVDMLFAACVTGAITGFAWCLLRNSSRGRVFSWLAAAAAVLTKGPAGIVLPGLLALAFLASGREMARWRALWSWPAASAALLAVGGWYAAATLTGGREFLGVQLVRENVDRFAGRGAFVPSRPFAWHLMPRYFLGHLAPWHLAIADDLRRRRGARNPPSPGGRLLHCWWLVVLAVFTVAAGKRAVYLLPLYPAIAILAARALLRGFLSRASRVVIAIGVVAGALVMLLLSRHHLVRAGERSGLVPLARATTALVPRTASLHASGNLPENDVLVLAYLLDRPVLRERVTCGAERPTAYYLRPVPSGVPATPLERLAVFGDVELGRCPTS